MLMDKNVAVISMKVKIISGIAKMVKA